MELFPDLPVIEKVDESYRVLARKYRPQKFADLVGQEALVRTLQNGLKTGRLAQAWILTGIRGIGKTTTARIIAKALNCIAQDGPALEPCNECNMCRAITDGRCLDVMEMDAASCTGIDDIREILDGVRYAPTSARYKIYIIDEVHMLSKNAFNALLKTLEEPPSQVKFIFATTEIRKVPLTILSRCQRFDLKRVEPDILVPHFASITKKENADADSDALQMIAKAADGSVRDGLSLLDQAIANGDGHVTAEQIKTMLGLADQSQVTDLLQAALKGEADTALQLAHDLYNKGADCIAVLQDLLEQIHGITRAKSLPNADVTHEQKMAADAFSIPVLTRAWQMLLKGLQEIQIAPNPLQALEMVLLRLIYASELPPPSDLTKLIATQGAGSPAGDAPPPPSGNAINAPVAQMRVVHNAMPLPQMTPQLDVAQDTAHATMPDDFRALAALFLKHDEIALYSLLYEATHLVKFAPGRLEIRPNAIAPKDYATKLSAKLQIMTGQRWWVAISNQDGALTLSEQDAALKKQALEDAATMPFVRAVLDIFPGARVIEITEQN